MKIAVLVSGGVDSSVALALLKEQGHDLTAFYLKIWLEDELSYLGNCPWQEDLNYVEATCHRLDVPLKVLSFQKEYHSKIVSYVISEVKAGRTPNPDIFCNKMIKFGAFYDAEGHKFDKIATGHYAQVFEQSGIYHLTQSPDPIKDQTYFLAHLDQAQLSKAIFPIGHLEKHEVRELAHKFNLPTKDRKDSQGICFLGKFKYNDFLKSYLGTNPGDLIEYETGKILGKHQGFWFHTIGQRQGSGLSGGPWYVVKKSPKENFVFISKQYYTESTPRDKFEISGCNWILETAPVNIDNLKVKLRHGPHFHDCTLASLNENRFAISINTQDQGIAPGQFAVFYKDGLVLGTGVILD